MYQEHGQISGVCSELIERAEDMWGKWFFLLRLKDPKVLEALRRWAILKFLEMADGCGKPDGHDPHSPLVPVADDEKSRGTTTEGKQSSPASLKSMSDPAALK